MKYTDIRNIKVTLHGDFGQSHGLEPGHDIPDDIRREPISTGFMQTHVLRLELADGRTVKVPACIIVAVSAGRITRIAVGIHGEVAGLHGWDRNLVVILRQRHPHEAQTHRGHPKVLAIHGGHVLAELFAEGVIALRVCRFCCGP